MKKFGLACEGVTDKATLKNILCGYFSIENPDDEIGELQPPFGESDGGGWRPFLAYLTLERFQDDVENNEFVIIQIDTDVSKDFDIPHEDNAGNSFPMEILIENVISKLKEKINEKELGIYEQYADKIIFAISVHSIECWLIAHYAEQAEIHDCFDKLKAIKFPKNTQLTKKQRNYDAISSPFLERKNIEAAAEKNLSFQVFIQSLESIRNTIELP
jgi:hypothetical protein